MKTAIFVVLLLSALAVVGADADTPATVAPPQPTVRITSPTQNLRQTADFIDLRYEAVGHSTSTMPSFSVRLDDKAAVKTASTQQTFTHLTPGAHAVTVQLLDDGGNAIPAAQAQVHVIVLPTSVSSAADSHRANAAPKALAGVTAEDHEESLPPASSALPILSVVGFGVLVGGIASAMKTR